MSSSRSLLSVRSLGLFMALIALTLLFGTAAPAAARERAQVFNINASVPAENLVVHPPGPIFEAIELAGNFVVEAHIVLPPGPPVAPQKMQVNLHLIADEITGTGMTTGDIYEGQGGGGATFHFDGPNANFSYQAAFRLHASDALHPPVPIRAQITFYVSIVESQDQLGAPSLNIVVNQDSLDN